MDETPGAPADTDDTTAARPVRGRKDTDPAAFAFWTRDTVRFSDIDRYRHVNNVAVATYCETGRVEFAESLWPGSTAGEHAGWMIVELTVRYFAQAHYPGEVVIGTHVLRVGRTSCVIGQGVFKDGVCFATSEAVLVWVDLVAGGPTPIPPSLEERLREEMVAPAITVDS